LVIINWLRLADLIWRGMVKILWRQQQSACRLYKAIEEELERCEVTGNLYADILNIAEPLSIIEILACDYLNAYSMIGQLKTEDHYSGYDPDDLPF
jgi:hypothetical protein